MKKCSFILVVLLFLIPAQIFAQGYRGKGRVKGTVTDQEGNPLEGVTIMLFSVKAQSGFEQVTDVKGKWKAFYIRGGAYNIDFAKDGYMPKKISANINEYDKNPDIDIALEKIEGVVIAEELKAELKAGNAFFEEGKYEEALQAFQVVVEKFPDAYILYQNIGNCYFQMERYEEAEASYLKVLEQDAENQEIKLAIGNTYANRSQEDSALEWYNKIDFEKLNDPLVLYNIGSSFYAQSKLEDALKYYRKAVDLKKDFPDALYQLGLVNLTIGNKQEAIDTFNAYLEHDPDSERATQVKGFIEYLKK
jgi:tetratricopeptide (TPR) repeat protein